jgi:hypothetical protein
MYSSTVERKSPQAGDDGLYGGRSGRIGMVGGDNAWHAGALEDAQERARSVAPACSSGVAVWINWGCVVNVVVLADSCV